MTFNPLEEKGIPLEKQLRSWHDIVKQPYNKNEIDCYSRTRQILMNGIECEAQKFKHAIARTCAESDVLATIAQMRKIEDMQQTTINWLAPSDQSVLETTLAYEQTAVELTAWLAQNEPDPYVREAFDFGLLEDFDHLYRYSQWAYMMHGINPNEILQYQTDVILGRPTQQHHNDNALRLRKYYDRNTANPQTKINILTLLSGEQQTHNYYSQLGFVYGNNTLRQTYAEIKDVEEEHVTMYESLIDPSESMCEKLLIHEFTEVCNYYACLEAETNNEIRRVWEEFLDYEIGHLQIAADLVRKYEKREPEEIIGKKALKCNSFTSQKHYVEKVLRNEADKRLCENKDYTTIINLKDTWPSYGVQKIVNSEGSPTEMTIHLIGLAEGRDLVLADRKLVKDEVSLLEKGLDLTVLAPDTVLPEELDEMMQFNFGE